MISIIIPTFNNLNYLKICLNSLKKNSIYNHEILLHINDGSDGTLDYVKEKKIKFTHTTNNVGLCTAVNTVGKIANKDLILYSHDDMYFCPKWDKFLIDEVNSLNHNNFYLSGTMIEPGRSAHIQFNCGEDFNNFDERKLLDNVDNLKFYNHQGSHFAPHLIHKDLWIKVGGFSEEFNPGMGSDPDFNMKLWNENVRIFKGIDKFRIYHFSSITTRKRGLIRNRGEVTFLKKWYITTKFFKKHYLKSNTKYEKPLSEPNKNIIYYFDKFICFFRRIFVIFLYKN